MITNERQYRIAQSDIQRFEAARSAVDAQNLDVHPKLRKAMRAGMESQLQDLCDEVAEYEALRDGKVTSLKFDTLVGVPVGLIKARIARGLTQKALAEALHLKEQQIQRYEATLYEGASIVRIQQVADVLGVREQVKLDLTKG